MCTCLIQVVLVTVRARLLLPSNLLPAPVTVLMVEGRRLQLLLLVLVAVVARSLHHARVRYRHLRVGKVPRILQHGHRVAVRLHPSRRSGGQGGGRGGGGQWDRRRGFG